MPRGVLAIQNQEVVNFRAQAFVDAKKDKFAYPKMAAVVNVPEGRFNGKVFYPDVGFGRPQRAPEDASTDADYKEARVGPVARQPMTFQVDNGTFSVLQHGYTCTVYDTKEAEYRETMGGEASLVQLAGNHLLLGAYGDLDIATARVVDTGANWDNTTTPGTLWNAATPGNMVDDVLTGVDQIELDVGWMAQENIRGIGGIQLLRDLQGQSQFVDQINATLPQLVAEQGNTDLYGTAVAKFTGLKDVCWVKTSYDQSSMGADESFTRALGRDFLVLYSEPGEYTSDNAPWGSGLIVVQNLEPTLYMERFGVGNAARTEIHVDFNFYVLSRSVCGYHFASATS